MNYILLKCNIYIKNQLVMTLSWTKKRKGVAQIL